MIRRRRRHLGVVQVGGVVILTLMALAAVGAVVLFVCGVVRELAP